MDDSFNANDIELNPSVGKGEKRGENPSKNPTGNEANRHNSKEQLTYAQIVRKEMKN